jgi:hypothetical protein
MRSYAARTRVGAPSSRVHRIRASSSSLSRDRVALAPRASSSSDASPFQRIHSRASRSRRVARARRASERADARERASSSSSARDGRARVARIDAGARCAIARATTNAASRDAPTPARPRARRSIARDVPRVRALRRGDRARERVRAGDALRISRDRWDGRGREDDGGDGDDDDDDADARGRCGGITRSRGRVGRRARDARTG